MKPNSFFAAGFFLLTGLTMSYAEPKVVAVLYNENVAESGLSLAQWEALDDGLRAQARAVLPEQEAFTVWSRQDLRTMLSPGQRFSHCSGFEDPLEKGRCLGADFVTQMQVEAYEEQLALMVELYETRKGQPLGRWREQAYSSEVFRERIQAKAPILFGNVRAYCGAPSLAVRPEAQKRDARQWAKLGMVAIPAGCFHMGHDEGKAYEKPAHRVCVSAFAMDTTEVTQGAYRSVMGENPSGFGTCGDQCPVENVSWKQTVAFCQQVGKRLPTEAEWEYAARAGTPTQWYCGDQESCLDRIAWYDSNSDGQTHPVGQKKANAWGLYDMAGNVEKRTSDWFGNDFYTISYGQDPVGAPFGHDRVNRGGSWRSASESLSSAHRDGNAPGGVGDNLGFRCVYSE